MKRQARRNESALIAAFKSERGCAICGFRDAVALDFDHLDPKEKAFNISEAMGKLSMERLMREIAKCRILCANCHRIESIRLGHNKIGHEKKREAPRLQNGPSQRLFWPVEASQ